MREMREIQEQHANPILKDSQHNHLAYRQDHVAQTGARDTDSLHHELYQDASSRHFWQKTWTERQNDEAKDYERYQIFKQESAQRTASGAPGWRSWHNAHKPGTFSRPEEDPRPEHEKQKQEEREKLEKKYGNRLREREKKQTREQSERALVQKQKEHETAMQKKQREYDQNIRWMQQQHNQQIRHMQAQHDARFGSAPAKEEVGGKDKVHSYLDQQYEMQMQEKEKEKRTGAKDQGPKSPPPS